MYINRNTAEVHSEYDTDAKEATQWTHSNIFTPCFYLHKPRLSIFCPNIQRYKHEVGKSHSRVWNTDILASMSASHFERQIKSDKYKSMYLFYHSLHD